MKITQHVKERYAERIMGRENKTDISVFISQHEQKIADDIEKMIAYGDLLYSGKSLRDGGNKADVYIKDKWIIIYDPQKDNVVTLYNIDLGVGDDYDIAFIARARNQIEAAKAQYAEAEARVKEDVAYYEEKIKDNECMISDYRQKIRNLESYNQAFKDVLANLKSDMNIADQKVREAVMVLTGRKIW